MTAGTTARGEPHLDELIDALLVRGQELAHVLLSRRLSAALYRRLAGGISPVQLQALAVLAGGDVRMRELARRLGLATSTVTRLVDRLEAGGLAERRNERPDRRSVLVGLTTAGHEALKAVRRRLRSFVHELIAGLTPHEQGEFLRLLSKVGEGLSVAAPEPPPVRIRSS
jgi:DNA-binding MarR family transcriptional regulator